MLHRWDDVRVFLACADHGSLSAAAEALGVQQSTVSRRIAALEEALGSPLFLRTPEGVTPTMLAEALLPEARAMQAHALALARAAAGDHTPEGRVRLALTETAALYLILPHLHTLQARHPALQLDLITAETTSDLSRGEAELALRFVRPVRGDLVATRVGMMALTAAVSPEHLRHHPAPTLDRGRWVSFELPWLETPEQRWFEAHLRVPPWLITNSYTTMTEAVLRGHAAGLLPSVLGERLGQALVPLEVDAPLPPPFEVFLVTHHALRHTARVRAVWAWLHELLTSLLDPDTTP